MSFGITRESTIVPVIPNVLKKVTCFDDPTKFYPCSRIQHFKTCRVHDSHVYLSCGAPRLETLDFLCFNLFLNFFNICIFNRSVSYRLPVHDLLFIHVSTFVTQFCVPNMVI